MSLTRSGKYDVGVAGLEGMGPGIAQNISSHLFHVAACDPHPRTGGSSKLAEAGQLLHTESLPELAGLLSEPRTIFVFGQTGAATDTIINQLVPHLAPRDLLIDAGDSYFQDAERRARMLAEHAIEFMSLGIAGGDAAARQGAMLMAGGRREVYARARPLLEALAANIHGRPSVGYLGSAGAACFARMVHAGVEYGLMQLISETFDLLQQTLAVSEEELRDVSVACHVGVLNGYLAEVSGHMTNPIDEGTERGQIREKLGALKADPAARWIAESAREMRVAIPTIDTALGTWDISPRERQRSLLQTPHRHPFGHAATDTEGVLDELTGALYTAMIVTYAEGFSLLASGSARHGFRLDPMEVARIWEGGCKLRASLLDDIIAALRATPGLTNLLCDEGISDKLMAHQEFLRHAVWRATEMGAVVPGLLAALDYLDSFRGAWMPVNLIQVQHGDEPSAVLDEREAEETVAAEF